MSHKSHERTSASPRVSLRRRLHRSGGVPSNGVLAAAPVGNAGYTPNASFPMFFAAWANTGTELPEFSFPGLLDEIAFLDKALTPAQIHGLWPAVLTDFWSLPPPDPLGAPEMRAIRNPRPMERSPVRRSRSRCSRARHSSPSSPGAGGRTGNTSSRRRTVSPSTSSCRRSTGRDNATRSVAPRGITCMKRH